MVDLTPLRGTRGGLRESRLVRSLIAHPHRAAAGLMALLVLAYLWPVLVGGRALTSTALLAIGAPWQASSPANLYRYINYELGDVPLSYYPWEVLARHLIHAGTFPAWNPYALAGTPLFSNLELAWLSPFSLPLWILPLNYALGVAAALKLWVAGFGTYLLVRELRLGFWPAIVAAISFTLCAFNVVWLTYGVFVSVAALLPWGLWLVERMLRRGRAQDGLWLALVAFLVLTGGHPGTAVHVVAGVALYACVRVLTAGQRTREQRLRSLALAGAGLAVGSLLAAVVLLPAQRAAVGTLGELIRRNGAPTLVETHVPFGALRTALFPEWWGRPVEHFNAGGSYFRERTFYAGVLPLILAVVGLASPGAWRRKAPFALLGALGLAVPLRAPLIYPLVIHLPLFDQVQDQRMLLWFLLAVAVLGAFGLEEALAAPWRPRVLAVLGGAALAGLIAAATQLDGRALGHVAGYVVHRTDHATAHTLALASVAWWTIFLLALAAVLALAWRRPRLATLAGVLIALLVALDLLHFAHGYNPMPPSSRATPSRTPAIAYLQRHARDTRIAGIGYTLPADYSGVYGLHDIRGDDPPLPTMDMVRLLAAADPQAEPSVLATITPASLKLIGMLGARYVIANPEATSPLPGLHPVYRGRDAVVFANDLALPRAWAARYVEVVGEAQTALAAVAGEAFDPRSQAVVRQDQLGGAPPPTGGAGSVRVVGEGNARVTLEARLSRRSLVVLDDQYLPGWTVAVDGRPAHAVRTNVLLRGVIVPAGTHRIEWSYRVPGLRAGAALSGVGLLAALTWAGVLVMRARRRRVARLGRSR